MSQPDCSHCGGLHFGSASGVCVYICEKCGKDIRPDVTPSCECPPTVPEHVQRFNIGGEPGSESPDGGPYITGTGRSYPTLKLLKMETNYIFKFDQRVQMFITDREGLKAIIADLVALL